MRITNNMLINNMINYIGNNLTRMDKYQSQMASGKKDTGPFRRPGSGGQGAEAAYGCGGDRAVQAEREGRAVMA